MRTLYKTWLLMAFLGTGLVCKAEQNMITDYIEKNTYQTNGEADPSYNDDIYRDEFTFYNDAKQCEEVLKIELDINNLDEFMSNYANYHNLYFRQVPSHEEDIHAKEYYYWIIDKTKEKVESADLDKDIKIYYILLYCLAQIDQEGKYKDERWSNTRRYTSTYALFKEFYNSDDSYSIFRRISKQVDLKMTTFTE